MRKTPRYIKFKVNGGCYGTQVYLITYKLGMYNDKDFFKGFRFTIKL